MENLHWFEAIFKIFARAVFEAIEVKVFFRLPIFFFANKSDPKFFFVHSVFYVLKSKKKIQSDPKIFQKIYFSKFTDVFCHNFVSLIDRKIEAPKIFDLYVLNSFSALQPFSKSNIQNWSVLMSALSTKGRVLRENTICLVQRWHYLQLKF